MQTENKKNSVTEYYRTYHNYNIEEVPLEVKVIVENSYRSGDPWEVEVIRRTIDVVNEFRRYNKGRKRKLSAMAYLKKFLPLYWEETYSELHGNG